MWDEQATRKPMLSLRLSASLLLRADERTLSASLFQAPRTARITSQGTPQSFSTSRHPAGSSMDGQSKIRKKILCRCAAVSEPQPSDSVASGPAPSYSMGDEQATRKPM